VRQIHHGDVQHFNRWAPNYDRTPGQFFFRWVQSPVAEALVRFAAHDSVGSVVDVGCGTGRLLERLLTLLPAAELAGVDLSEGMIRMARARFQAEPRVRLEVAAANHLPFEDASVDAVTTTLSFHHWDHQAEAMREVTRVLRPGGRLLLADVLAIGPFGRFAQMIAGRHGTGADLAEMLNGAGFTSWRRRAIFAPGIPIYLVEARRALTPR